MYRGGKVLLAAEIGVGYFAYSEHLKAYFAGSVENFIFFNPIEDVITCPMLR